jgi:hypothetical protein
MVFRFILNTSWKHKIWALTSLSATVSVLVGGIIAFMINNQSVMLKETLTSSIDKSVTIVEADRAIRDMDREVSAQILCFQLVFKINLKTIKQLLDFYFSQALLRCNELK